MDGKQYTKQDKSTPLWWAATGSQGPEKIVPLSFERFGSWVVVGVSIPPLTHISNDFPEFKFRPWETISAGERATYFPLARTAIAAALNAWAGRWLSDGMQNLVLPLHTGARDD